MTKSQQEGFLKLIQQGSIEALKSEEGKEAIVNALNSDLGQGAIKRGSLAALKSEDGEKIFSEYFIDNFKEVVVPAFEDHENRIENLEKHQLIV